MPKIIEEYKQDPPFCLQVELVEGCNLRCDFCGLNGIRGKENNMKFMTLETTEKIVSNLKSQGWTSRIEFAMHGEPSFNPDIVKILRLFREELPNTTHLMVTSNGGGFLKNPLRIDEVLEFVNVLAFDQYDGLKLVPHLLKKYRKLGGKVVEQNYPENPKANPHRRRKTRERDLVVIQDISTATKGTHSTLNNHAGAGAPLNDHGVGKKCAKPFREMSIRWDGSVAVCCNDWRGVYKCGNVNEMSLEEIWQTPAMDAARKKLYRGIRDFGPCKGCDAKSYRVGLLPDKYGKIELEEPNAKDEKTISQALKGKPYTLPVLRAWEIKK